jgi:hypothetical protein
VSGGHRRLPVCEGIATDDDLARDESNRKRRAEGRLASRRLIREHGLPMKVTAVDFIGADNVFVVYFSAPHRVDFRALVRDLGGRLKARVELRQIGPRDEARLQGGIGPCGRDLCCATFLKDFEPVSVRMAKDQELPVNPLRIAGACGRLMCCLKYEHPLYQDFRKDAPPVGATVTSPEGRGHGDRPQRPLRHGRGQAGRRRPGRALPQGQRVRVAEGVRVPARERVRPGAVAGWPPRRSCWPAVPAAHWSRTTSLPRPPPTTRSTWPGSPARTASSAPACWFPSTTPAPAVRASPCR